MRKTLQHLADLHLNSQLLAQFTNQALLEGFLRLTFAAREFPQPAQVRAFVPLSDEKFTAAKNKTGCNFDLVSSWLHVETVCYVFRVV